MQARFLQFSSSRVHLEPFSMSCTTGERSMKNLLRILLSCMFAASLGSAAFAQSVGGGGGAAGGGGTVTQGTAAGSGPWIFTPWIAGAVNSVTNGIYFNPLQGNAALSATNGLYSNILQGNAALSVTNGLYANLLQGNAVNASGNPIFVQLTAGAASLGTVGLNTGSNLVGKFGIDQTTPGTTNAVSLVPLTNAQGGNLTPVVSGALEANHVFKASAGNLYSAYATSTTGAAGYFVCINATSISPGAITPIEFIAIAAGPTTAGISYSPGPPGAYSTGITCAVTVAATPFTYTAPGSVIAYHGLVN
jgi:hypothetical protein